MTYFEVKERLAALIEFRTRFAEYSNFTNRTEDNIPAKMIRNKLEPLAPVVVDSLAKVGLGRVVVKDSPARGGRKIQVNVIKAIFRERLMKRYDIPDHTAMRMLDAGISKYNQMLWVQKIQLFNPLFWLYQIVLFIAKTPLMVFEGAGFNTVRVNRSAAAKALVVVLQLVCYYFLIQWSGLAAFIRFDILTR